MMDKEEIEEDGENRPEPSFLASEPMNSHEEALPPSLSLSSLVGLSTPHSLLLSLSSLVGLSTPHSLKLEGQIGN